MEENILIATEMLVVGMSTVFVVLSAFAFIIWFLKLIDSKLSSKKTAQPILEVQKEFFESKSEQEIAAVIAAAATAVIGKKLKVKKIHFLDSHHDEANWSHSGRLNIMGSHNINIKGH